MKVISDTTLVTRSDEGRVDHAPGTPVTLPAADAKDLIERGLARAVTEAPTEARAPEPGAPPGAEPESADSVVLQFLNEGTASDLQNIKGVGKKTAGDIVASREADGPFESLEQCAERVGGVSLEQLEAASATA